MISSVSRKLASIRTANEILPIEGADAIEVARVDGWKCVVKKGEFNIGDKGIYFEIDSFLPASDPRFGFLSKQFITWNEKLGARLKTIRLRNQLSQGLFLPLTNFPEFKDKEVGSDVTAELGIDKWEPPTLPEIAGKVSIHNPFPHFIPKTDQERVQNLLREITNHAGKEFEVTIKLDGSSMTVYRHGEKTGVCSRNLDVKEDEKSDFWNAAKQHKLIDALMTLDRNLALQGELIGEGIQGNPEKIKGKAFYVFDIYDIDNGKHLSPVERREIMKHFKDNKFEINHVPILDNLILNHTVEELLTMAEGPSMNPKVKREGLVFKRMDGLFSFKAISNSYLEKHKNR